MGTNGTTGNGKRRRGRPRVEGLAERRSDQILDAAVGIFARDGFDCADVQAVADRIGVGKGTIYRYFPTKRALFLAAADRGMKRMRAEVEAAFAGIEDPLEQIKAGIRKYLCFFDAHPEFVELLIQERAAFRDRKKSTYFEDRESHAEARHARYRGLMEAGRVRRMPVKRIADVVGNLVYGTMFTNFFAGRKMSFEDQAEDILDVVFNGILTAEERGRTRTKAGGSATRGGRNGKGKA